MGFFLVKSRYTRALKPVLGFCDFGVRAVAQRNDRVVSLKKNKKSMVEKHFFGLKSKIINTVLIVVFLMRAKKLYRSLSRDIGSIATAELRLQIQSSTANAEKGIKGVGVRRVNETTILAGAGTGEWYIVSETQDLREGV